MAAGAREGLWSPFGDGGDRLEIQGPPVVHRPGLAYRRESR
jgi:hypothetical protein